MWRRAVIYASHDRLYNPAVFTLSFKVGIFDMSISNIEKKYKKSEYQMIKQGLFKMTHDNEAHVQTLFPILSNKHIELDESL